MTTAKQRLAATLGGCLAVALCLVGIRGVMTKQETVSADDTGRYQIRVVAPSLLDDLISAVRPSSDHRVSIALLDQHTHRKELIDEFAAAQCGLLEDDGMRPRAVLWHPTSRSVILIANFGWPLELIGWDVSTRRRIDVTTELLQTSIDYEVGRSKGRKRRSLRRVLRELRVWCHEADKIDPARWIHYERELSRR